MISQKTESFVRDLLSQIRNNHTELIGCLRNEHRTHQQSMMRFCVSFIEAMAKNGSDLRNEAAVTFAKEVVEKIENRSMPYI